MSTLFEAIHEGDDAVVRVLRGGVSPETDDEGETPLYRAAVANEPGIVRLLLAAGADPGRGSGEEAGDLPLCGAACGGHAEAVRALLAGGARADQAEAYGFTALDWAVRLGHAETVRILLEHGAAPSRPGPDGLPPLVAAARRGSAASVRALLEYGAGPAEDALREARRWIGVDIAEELRRGLLAPGGPEGSEETVVRRVREDGGVTVVVDVLRADGAPSRGNEQQTGHAAIATLLEGALGVRVPPEELAGRALRCGDPDLDDWKESVRALAHRDDEETFRTATAWCAGADPLRRALGARVLGALGRFTAQAVPVLRRLAAQAAADAAREPALSVVIALGRCGEPQALPELLALASHPDAEVRRALGSALTGPVPAGHSEAVATLIALSRDHDHGVRDWATLALAEVPEDTPVLREALAARLADDDEDAVAEAARGLAMRQDPRAVEVLAGLLADGDPEGTARDTALAAVEYIADPRVRTRLEWTTPRCR
ncbi:ankyrin repeat domain-containing protein [Streptomyces sp. Je 1-79]|uniref:ankyrin repeat domain-containing protein n=1 Tax=Streptomyces sp. Je 1-79 TaxID=2943847 RepID=UPI0021A2A514|nr:ankyrin repeat domain-containing protein [Streptomyces sp. Je 1-79]MCT4355146.1 ankyrin repeat domain-containing protein [Streptomyces sp. Je 1-79]